VPELRQRYVPAVPLDQLAEHPDNPNQGNDTAVAESIRVNGWFGAVLVQESTGFVVAGNTRLRSARLEGLTELPVIYVDVDDHQAKRILAADNQLARLATMDDQSLAALLDDIIHGDPRDRGLAGTGYHMDDVDELLERINGTPVPGFSPGGENPRLDERAPVTCPACGHTWNP
jgi:ParB-like chromosome segregation protein Spo0J